MQITLFYDCYYSSPSVKRSSHTLWGCSAQTVCCATFPLRWCQTTSIFSLLFAESALLFFSASGHCSLSPGSWRMYQELFFTAAIHHLSTRCPRTFPPTLSHLFTLTHHAHLFTHLPLIKLPPSFSSLSCCALVSQTLYPTFTSPFILDMLHVLTCCLYIICRLVSFRLSAILLFKSDCKPDLLSFATRFLV